MNYQIIRPPEQLKDIVRCFWSFEISRQSTMTRVYQSMADGYAEMIFQHDGGFTEMEGVPFYLRAPKTEVRQLHLTPQAGMFGVRFFPHALTELFNTSSPELINETADVKHVIGSDASMLTDSMYSVAFPKKVEIMSKFLLKTLKRRSSNPMTAMAGRIISQEGQVNIRSLQEQSGYSERQFERKFVACVGFSPKHFARIIRYQTTKSRYAKGSFRNLAELAQASNYCDQSHFIREFKEFSGMHPKQYFNIINDVQGEESRIIKGLVLAKD